SSLQQQEHDIKPQPSCLKHKQSPRKLSRWLPPTPSLAQPSPPSQSNLTTNTSSSPTSTAAKQSRSGSTFSSWPPRRTRRKRSASTPPTTTRGTSRLAPPCPTFPSHRPTSCPSSTTSELLRSRRRCIGDLVCWKARGPLRRHITVVQTLYLTLLSLREFRVRVNRPGVMEFRYQLDRRQTSGIALLSEWFLSLSANVESPPSRHHILCSRN
ncbi:hypothetical protein IWX46DRAFT_187680, partial [Phyllosticta citricarpa]